MSKLIVIDPGHGGVDPGACGNGLRECDINLKLAKMLEKSLEQNGFLAYLTRNQDTYMTLSQRCAVANVQKADLFISLHCNAFGDKSANGLETLVYSKTANNTEIAEDVQKRLLAISDFRDRGVKERRDLFVLNSTRMVAILIELGFITHLNDARQLRDDNFLSAAAENIAAAVSTYFYNTTKISAYETALKTLSNSKGVDFNYWRGKRDIDPGFENLIILLAE